MKFRQMRPSSFISSIGPWHPVDASGGVESTITVGSIVYKLHVFYNIGSDTLVINDSGTDGTVEYLVVAGGGGGGMDMGGGGGGGGVLMGRHTVVSGSSMAVTVGSGGLGGPGGSQKDQMVGQLNPVLISLLFQQQMVEIQYLDHILQLVVDMEEVHISTIPQILE